MQYLRNLKGTLPHFFENSNFHVTWKLKAVDTTGNLYFVNTERERVFFPFYNLSFSFILLPNIVSTATNAIDTTNKVFSDIHIQIIALLFSYSLK